MKKNLKLPISSLIIVLAFTSSQAIHGMEDLSKSGEQGGKITYDNSVSIGSDINEKSKQKKIIKQKNKETKKQKNRRDDEIYEFPFERCPIEIKYNIIKFAAINHCLSN